MIDLDDVQILAGLLSPVYVFLIYYVARTEHRLTRIEQHCEDTHGSVE